MNKLLVSGLSFSLITSINALYFDDPTNLQYLPYNPIEQSEIYQGYNTFDRIIIEEIRLSLKSDIYLSQHARNIEIYAIDGNVTLNGVVTSEAERDRVLRYAYRPTGVRSVTDNLRTIGYY